MKKYLRIWLAFMPGFFVICNSFGQYPIFSPNRSNYIFVNPAFAGSRICPHLGLDYIYQNNPNPVYNTIYAEFDTHINPLRGGIGLTFIGDRLGDSFQTLAAGGIYSRLIHLSRNIVLRPAIKLEYTQSEIEFSSFTNRYNLQNENNISIPGSSKSNYLSVGGGLLVYSSNYFAGFSVDNINTPKEAELFNSEMRIPLKYSIIGGVEIKKGKNSLFPVLTYQWQDKRFPVDSLNIYMLDEIRHFSVNLNYKYNKLISGIGYRYIFNYYPSYHIQAGYDWDKIQFKYNIGVSPYKTSTGVNKTAVFHQLSAEYNFNCKPRKRKIRPIYCPAGFGSGSGTYYTPAIFVSAYSSSANSSSNSGIANNTTIADISIKPGTLTAGEINDFTKWELWKDIAKEDLKTFRNTWEISPMKRYTVQVVSDNNKPIVDCSVDLKYGNFNIWSSKTDNTGKAELWSGMFDGDTTENKDLNIKVTVNNNTYSSEKITEFHDGINLIKIPEPCNYSNQIDMLFVVDATGSMEDEIKYLKEELKDITDKVGKNYKELQLNLGSVFYRCLDNSYVTEYSPFSSDADKTIQFINKHDAGEGGIEAVEEAIDVAVNKLEWSDNARARILFIILDEPPDSTVSIIKKMENAVTEASAKGIRIIPVVASGTSFSVDKSLEYLMRSWALATNGTYAFLTDHSGVGDKHTAPSIDEYDVELMNDLILRLIYQYTYVPSCNDSVLSLNGIQDTMVIVNPYIIDHVIVDSTKINKTDTSNHINNTLLVTNNDTITNTSDSINLTSDEPADSIVTDTTKDYLKSFKYYPNPTRGPLHIEIDGNIEALYLSDLSGKLLEKFEVNNQKSIDVNINGYPTGIYFINFLYHNKRICGKVILTN